MGVRVSMWERFGIDWVLWVDCQWVKYGLPREERSQQGTVPIAEQLYQIFIWVDQGLNVFPLMGSADETMSSRCFRMNHIPAYRYLEIFVNKLYYPFQGLEHCRNAYMKEVRGRQLPDDFFDKAIAMGIFPTDPDKLGDMVRVPE